MSVHCHGGPIWGDRETPSDDLIKALYRNGCSLVSFARPDQIKKIAAIDCKLVLDNGAFSTWRKAGNDNSQPDAGWWQKHWATYYDFVGAWFSRIEWFIIPDVIEGSEAENDHLIEQVPYFCRRTFPLPFSALSPIHPIHHKYQNWRGNCRKNGGNQHAGSRRADQSVELLRQ